MNLNKIISCNKLLTQNGRFFLPQTTATMLQKYRRYTNQTGANNWHGENKKQFQFVSKIMATLACGITVYYTCKSVRLLSEKKDLSESNAEAEHVIYTIEDVKLHDSKEKGVWVTYKDGVYDITDFIDEHPGGEIILTAAGDAVDPFWNLYGVHKQDHIKKILEKYKIGKLSTKEAAKSMSKTLPDPYDDEPKRSYPFIVNAEKPFNAEPHLTDLVKKFITPVDVFYVRNHLPVPNIDIDDYELVISGLGVKETKFTLDELKTKFQKHTITATVMCAGNRRSDLAAVLKKQHARNLNFITGKVPIIHASYDSKKIHCHGPIIFHTPCKAWAGCWNEACTPKVSLPCIQNTHRKVKPVKGLNWSAGAIGNATWSGAKLSDVLNASGFVMSDNIKHIHFEGLDTDVQNVPYGASIPIGKILNPSSDIILAYEMNGEPLPRDHGFPIRVIVPGVVGARNVKWLSHVIMSEHESPSHWQQNDYKGFSPNTDWDTVDFKTSNSIQELPVISAICQPNNEERVQIVDGKLRVKGYAWSGGGCKIWRVDVSANQGKTWHAAKIVNQEETNPGRSWSWALWEIDIPITDKYPREVELWSKAVDSNYNVQPETSENIWNLRGVLSNAYHRIKVYVV